MKFNSVLLLTACINPNGMLYTKLQDCNVRLSQYRKALNWYLVNTEYPIIFVENTNTYIGSEYMQYIDSGRVEFITFEGNDFPRHLGKGYGEALILKKALEKSVLLKKSDFVIKVTGRLIIKNIKGLVKESLKVQTISSLAILNRNGNNICSSYFIILPLDFFKDYFLPEIGKINDSKGVYFEHVLYNAIVKWINGGKKFHSFYRCIDVVGESGSTGVKYPNKTLKASLKAFLKAFYINVRKHT